VRGILSFCERIGAFGHLEVQTFKFGYLIIITYSEKMCGRICGPGGSSIGDR